MRFLSTPTLSCHCFFIFCLRHRANLWLCYKKQKAERMIHASARRCLAFLGKRTGCLHVAPSRNHRFSFRESLRFFAGKFLDVGIPEPDQCGSASDYQKNQCCDYVRKIPADIQIVVKIFLDGCDEHGVLLSI